MLSTSGFALILLLSVSTLVSGSQETLDAIHRKLNIPPDAKAVVIFGQASHLDWDWLNWFPTNVNNVPPSVINYWGPDVQPTDTIFSHATDYLADSNYGYSVCEMGFLRRFSVDKPDLWAKMKQGNLHIVGGGITSPDNLLPHGEAFIRDYLVGISWVKSQNISWGRKVWLPDDFGHDSQLPVMLQALGIKAVSFSRLPGGCQQGRDTVASGVKSAHQVLMDRATGGLDFYWQANDGSTAYTYYQPNGYCCGDGLYSSGREPNTPELQASCQSVSVSNVTQRIQAYLGVRSPLKTTPYMYVATGCDFRVPLPNLVQTLTQWNDVEYPKTGTYAVSASFDDYADLVLAYLQKTGGNLYKRNFHGTTPTTTFKPTPYWMGFYTSRVANKQLHYETVKNLLGAETYLAISHLLGVQTRVTNEQIKITWNLTAPSTHHDFITGTATDYVFLGEQQPLLQTVLGQAKGSKNQVLTDIVTAMSGGSGSPVWAAFNQLGFNRVGAASISLPSELSESGKQNLKNFLLAKLPNSVQIGSDGELISIFSAPSLGYSTQSANIDSNLGELRLRTTADSYTFENSFLTATVAKNANWAITSIVDKSSGQTVVTSANGLEFRADNGNIYRYGYEEGCGFDNINPQITANDGQIVENGPVRVTVSASISVRTSSGTNTFTFLYSLVAGEPFVRVSVTGAAPDNTAILAKINFAQNSAISTYEHGTPYHWDFKAPQAYGLQNDFKVTIEATHDFIIPKSASGSILGAVYHNSTPAWGVSEDKSTLYGVLLRNSPSGCAGKGAEGHDALPHTVSYAVRIPSGLSGSGSGQPLREARGFHTPLQAFYITSPSFSKVPSKFSLAAVTNPNSGILTVGKPGEYNENAVVFRVYTADNSAKQVQITVASQLTSSSYVASQATALEEPTGPVTWSGPTISYNTAGALTTVQLAPK